MSLNGIDIGDSQAYMDVKSIDGDFVIIKATQSNYYKTKAYENQLKSAQQGTKEIGFYHFFDPNVGVESQADYFLNVIGNNANNHVLALDFEDDPQDGIYVQNMNAVVKAKQWLDYVYSQTGIKPLLYTGLSIENNFDWTAIVHAGYPLWVAQYNSLTEPVNGFAPRELFGSLKNWKSATIFQYASTGRLPGWNHSLDLDVFYGNVSDWKALATGKSSSEPNPKPNPKPKPTKPSVTDTSGAYTFTTATNIRTAPSLSASIVGQYNAGETVVYNGKVVADGYTWLKYLGTSGEPRYVAIVD